MSESLFREEALTASKAKAIGTVALYCPPYRWLVISVAAFITLSITLIFIFGTYTKKESAIGELVPQEGVLTVVPAISGTVIKIFVTEGKTVHKDEPLIEISSEVNTYLGGTRKMVSQQLLLQRAHLEKDLIGLSQLHNEAINGHKAQITSLKEQIVQLEKQAKQRGKQVVIARSQLNKMQKMRIEGYASNTQVEQQEVARLEADARLQETINQILDVKQRLSQSEQQLREQPINTLNQRHDIERKLADIEQSLAENESRRSVILKAPQDGIVGTILTQTGKMVSAGQSLISILPESSLLQARMMVSSRAIGFVQKGQRVVLRYQAFPYQKFGQQYGRVLEVSRTALSPQEVATITGNNDVREQHYRVLVALDNQLIDVYGKREKLRPGIALDADFQIDRRRLYEWVLEPLYALGRRSAA
jgi:membrane fusion protein